VDLDALRAGNALPPPPAAATPPPPSSGGAATAGTTPAPIGEPKAKKGKPFYKSPVFWVVAAVGLYVVIVLAQDNSPGSQPTARLLPDGPSPATGGGATLFRF